MAGLNIVVGGYIVGFPLGGMTWHHLNYLLGLADLGHCVTFLEDGAYLPPIDPTTGHRGDPTYGLNYLRRTFETYGLNIPWHYRYGTISAGLSNQEIDDTLRRADLLICVSGVTPVEYRPMPRRSLVIDTDPVYTQLRMRDDAVFLDYYRQFTACATFGMLIGTPRCPLPTHGIDWIGTCQPVHLPAWPATPPPPPDRAAFTTLGQWEHAAERHHEFEGKTYKSAKGEEWHKLLDLPAAGGRFELAMAQVPADVQQLFERHGWAFTDPAAASASCASFAAFVGQSLAELSVAKQIYAGLPSGWFSDRSACYLAAGRPVVLQATGFEHWLPTGGGLHVFGSADEARVAIRRILQDPQGESRAARAVAEARLDARAVLSSLLEAAMSKGGPAD
ncbi:MAG: hypothetical protein ACFCVE_02900 [Phycisphaerae bacterium]